VTILKGELHLYYAIDLCIYPIEKARHKRDKI